MVFVFVDVGITACSRVGELRLGGIGGGIDIPTVTPTVGVVLLRALRGLFRGDIMGLGEFCNITEVVRIILCHWINKATL